MKKKHVERRHAIHIMTLLTAVLRYGFAYLHLTSQDFFGFSFSTQNAGRSSDEKGWNRGAKKHFCWRV